MYKTVLITTSGIGQRLGNITKYTNKSLINVGDKYAICHIIEQYNINTEFVITLGYYGDLVKDFLLLAYPSRKFIFVEIDNYVGEGSSLVYSISKTKNVLQKPFIFHCCDAIVLDNVSFEDNKNILCVYKMDNSKQYTNIKVKENKVLEINRKNHLDFDYIYTGISHINDYSIFWNNLESIYNNDKLNEQLSDVDIIRKMIQQDNINFEYIVLNKWYDTGNIDSYNEIKKNFKAEYTVLDKNNESLCFFDDVVIKFINDSHINKKRIERGKLLYPFTPKIINSSNNFILMEKIEGTVLSEYYNHGEIYKLLNWANTNLWSNKKNDSIFKDNCYNFYIKKTLKRIDELSFIKDEMNIINGINSGNIFELINKIDLNLLITDSFSHFHGDFILDNIIKTTDSFKLIDWRHEFDNQLEYGDIYYDLAKLKHNIIFNHKNVSSGLYEIIYEKDSITLDLKCNYFLIQQLYDFEKFIVEQNLNLNKINIITSLIWLNMSPLYEGKLSEFLFYFGKYNLYLAINNM